jgi:hypothetical protein
LVSVRASRALSDKEKINPVVLAVMVALALAGLVILTLLMMP